jgi:hypothetical protein
MRRKNMILSWRMRGIPAQDASKLQKIVWPCLASIMFIAGNVEKTSKYVFNVVILLLKI